MRIADEPRASGADFLQLDCSKAPARGLTDWLVAEIRESIADGRLSHGQRLPATRALADDLSVSRGVVVETYRRLTDEGLLDAHGSSGTRVAARPARPTLPDTTADRSRRGRDRLPRPREQSGEVIDLTPGVPDLSAFPRHLWLRAERAVLSETPWQALGYGDPRGHPQLRSELAGWLTRTRGLRAAADDILVVAGVAQSVALTAQSLHRNGTRSIAVEEPGSRGVLDELRHWGLQPVPIRVDDEGILVDELAASGATSVLLTPAHQFPTGVALSPARRRALLGWAENAELIIEDDYDAEYRYDRAPVPALKAAAPERIAYTGSVSKALAPALRLGWLVPPSHHYDDLVDAKHASDLGSPTRPQLVLAHLLATGQYDRHTRLTRIRHRARRDALLDGLGSTLPGVSVLGVAAGLHLVITIADLASDDQSLCDTLRAEGIVVQPLSMHRQLPGQAGLVVGYAACGPDQLRLAGRRIARVLTSS